MKKQLLQIILTAVLFTITFWIKSEYLKILILLTAYLIVSYDILIHSIKHIFKGKVFDEYFLMSLASIGAFCIGEYPEGVAIMLFYKIGELFERYSVSNSKKSIKEMLDLRPEYANLKIDENIKKVAPNLVKLGEIILVKPGEKIPLDGVIIKGSSSLDTSALTGESKLKDVGYGDEVKSGSINTNGVLEIKVNTTFENSIVSKILQLVENSIHKKSKSEKFITKFARVYTPIVVTLALIVAFLPPLILPNSTFSEWIYKALIFLVVSCPCALVISVPLSFFGGIGGASKNGILIKGSIYLEALTKLETLAFDKTGTLTEGKFYIDKIVPFKDITKDELLKYAAYGEAYSTHPIAISVVKAYNKSIDESKIKSIQELPGLGIKAIIGDDEILVGNKKLINSVNTPNSNQTAIYISINSKYAGYITLKDKLKDEAKSTISWLNKNKIKTAILTGDSDVIAQDIASNLGILKVSSELLPADKVCSIENFLKDKKQNFTVGYVGDGINDAPVLARADVGISVFGSSDAAMEASDIVLMDKNLKKIISAIKISRKTLSIAKQNIVFAIGIKVGVMLLGIFGLANIWMAIFADVGVTVLAILNALRPYIYSVKLGKIPS
ncbi:heavy metal translocating P-type ATPase [Campylobacter blaseri]|uniref:P-type Zn(2+) transporter n=1 Tax=Campylobacter blaseri TaxID=2042961 RepID=A0A2P8QZ17_9BACT|nr:heavy metal translocating P-type ATPase [Campylobacter blaseri]PSM51482.1 cadmium-translocating P-type ATPase [Campylobacter blaseri]PSM52931.1 cadmium-translocating P-type ATPase [Campylobacter blaseri]QKF86510.1 heavy metal translocating P-type ATPase [Campylobacter blaseri]